MEKSRMRKCFYRTTTLNVTLRRTPVDLIMLRKKTLDLVQTNYILSSKSFKINYLHIHDSSQFSDFFLKNWTRDISDIKLCFGKNSNRVHVSTFQAYSVNFGSFKSYANFKSKNKLKAQEKALKLQSLKQS